MSIPRELVQLAEAYGVEPGYEDVRQQWHDAEPEALVAVLRLLGAEVDRVDDAPEALRARRAPAASGTVEPLPPAPRGWGVFAPLYAVRDDRGGPIGDLGTLAELRQWAGALGAGWVATLPLLAAFADEPSPYRPVSRLAWNERYLDVAALPEVEAGDLAGRPPDTDLVDWPAVTAWVHGVLDRAVARLSDRRRDELAAFEAAHPEREGFAAFMGGDDPTAVDRHRYAQWAFALQLAGGGGAGLYLDLPVGVHPDGYDVARWPHAHATGASAGAPPDDFFAAGQSWGFPPLHPEGSRRDGHAYLRACVEHHAAVSDLLRLDHVMGLHRLWWVPDGFEPAQGVYVRYPAAELFGVVTEVARRHGTVVVGENLGTVPPVVHELLHDHGWLGMWPLLLVAAGEGELLPPTEELALLGTHDTATFAAAWAEGGEVRRRLEDLSGTADPGLALGRLLEALGRSPARQVQVNLEDLWLEPAPQNVPGTGAEAANWRRRFRRDGCDDAALDRLHGLAAAREEEPGDDD